MPKVGTFLANQGVVDQDVPEHQFRLSFDAVSENDPDWVDVTGYVRSFGSARGRTSELSDMDAGTATWLLSNRDRRFDPTNAAGPYYPNVRPMNRMWHRIQWAGATYDVFRGWAENWPQTYPGMTDAVVPVNGVDEFKPLALGALPTTDPPRDTYDQVVLSDYPVAYWRMNSAATDIVQPAVTGPEMYTNVGVAQVVSELDTGATVGDNPDPFAALGLGEDTACGTETLGLGAPPDVGGRTEFAVELWFRTSDATPASAETIASGTPTGASNQWRLMLNTNGTVAFTARSTAPSDVTVTSAQTLNDDTWYYLVGVLVGGTLYLYVDAVVAASTAFATAIEATTTGHFVQFGDSTSGSRTFWYDECAIYATALTAARIAAHLQAGRERGFPREQPTHERIIAALDTVTSRAPRSIRGGGRNMIGAFMRGQSPLDEIRDAVHAEAVDSTLFIAADGTIVFLDAAHRASSPWNTAQATFGDSGSELPYQDITLDYSDSFIANEWNVTTLDGLTQTASDATSIAAYGKRSQSITGLKITNGDAVALDVADDMLAKYKDPILRITGLQPQTSDGPTLTATLGLELGDKIRVKRRPPGGGSAIDQSPWVQRIEVSGTPGVPPTVKLGVSPV